VIAQSPTTPTKARLGGVRVLAVEDRPDVSSLTIVRRLRALPGAANMSIVAFTAETNSSKRDEAIKQGVEYYVMKPDFVRLMHVVAHAAGR
jgi:CheY-like chemotaxis protein